MAAMPCFLTGEDFDEEFVSFPHPQININNPAGSRAVLQRQYSTTGRKPTSKIDESTTVNVSSTHILLQGLLQIKLAPDACAPQRLSYLTVILIRGSLYKCDLNAKFNDAGNF